MKKIKSKKFTFFICTACLITAFSFLKSSTVSSQINEIKTNPNTEFNITYELDGGKFEDGVTAPTKYKYSQETTIPNPVKDGAEFLGWTINDKTDAKHVKDYKIPKGTIGDVKLTANWKVKENLLLNGFYFKMQIRNKINESNLQNLREIRFVKEKPNLDGIDVSESQDSSIKMNVEGNILYVKSESEIFANPDCSNMFDYSDWSLAMNIDKIYFTNFNTSKVQDMSYMFYRCRNLTDIVGIENFSTSQVTNMNSMFTCCDFYLIDLNLKNWDTSKVTDMGNMFNMCYALKSLDISNWDTSQVTNMNSMFANCRQLTSLDLSSFNTRNVTNMKGMFSGSDSLLNLNISTFDTSKVTDMSSMFENCTKLSGEITIMNPYHKYYQNMFLNCSTDSNAKFYVKYIGDFTKSIAEKMVATKTNGCNVFLYSPSTLLDGATFNSMIKNYNIIDSSQISKIIFDGTIREMPSDIPVNKWVDVSEKGDKSIVAYVDGYTLYIASDVEIMANTNCSEMFKYFTNITSIEFNNFNTSNVTNMYKMFYNCSALTNLDVSNWNTSKVTDMSYMFVNCCNLTSLDLNIFDTRQVTDMSYIFYNCNRLWNLDVSSFNTSKVTNMSYMFYDCNVLHGEITIMNPNITYSGIFDGCCQTSGRFVVNYVSGCKTLAQDMLNTKSPYANVVLGTLKSLLNEDITNDEEVSVPDTITLTIKDGKEVSTKEITDRVIGSLESPVKEGKVFVGYFYDTEYTKSVSEKDVIAKDTTIYIKWEDNDTNTETPQNEEIPQEENKDESFGEVA